MSKPVLYTFGGSVWGAGKYQPSLLTRDAERVTSPYSRRVGSASRIC